MVNDTISDMLTRIRNSIRIGHHMVKVPKTKVNYAIAQVLKDEEYIVTFEHFIDNKNCEWLLLLLQYSGKFHSKKSKITNLKRISKPSNRVYSKHSQLPNVLGDFGLAILSTSRGIMSNYKAADLKIGGEVLCYIW